MSTRPEWNELRRMATEEIDAILGGLARPLRERAAPLPVTFQRCPNEEQLADGLEPDILGLFLGPEMGDELATLSPLPPQIILFLHNLWDMAEEDPDFFRDEVRTTYLHELGHYLGLDEDDLIDRGLE